MNAHLKPREFPLPSTVKVISGTERAQAAYPYHVQFAKSDDQKFWFYNSMHFPEPMTAFDMVTAEAAYCALGAANTRVHCLPTTLGIDHRIINGRVYIGGNAVTDPKEIVRRTAEFQKRAFYYYQNWESLYAQWKQKMLKLIEDAKTLPDPALPEFEPLEHVPPCRRHESGPHARRVNEVLAAEEAHYQRINSQIAAHVTTHHELLPKVDAILSPEPGSLTRLVDAVGALGNRSLQAMALHESQHFRRRPV